MHPTRRLEPRAKQTWISTFKIEFYENFLMTHEAREWDVWSQRKPCFCVAVVGSSHFVLHWHAVFCKPWWMVPFNLLRCCHFCRVLKSIWCNIFSTEYSYRTNYWTKLFHCTTFWLLNDCGKFQISEAFSSGTHNIRVKSNSYKCL